MIQSGSPWRPSATEEKDESYLLLLWFRSHVRAPQMSDSDLPYILLARIIRI